MTNTPNYRLAVDIGGTFTDVVLQSDANTRWMTKVLTTAQAPEQGVLNGIKQVLTLAGKTANDIALFIHGTTLATNALIERKGAKTALLTSAGFRDILEMGFEKRYAHYDLQATLPPPLVPRPLRFEVTERMRANGAVITPLDETEVRQAAKAMREAEVKAVAIGFLHAYAHPQHEQQAASIITDVLPEATVCLSSEVCPEMREYERFSTTCANAYVRPLIAGYLNRLRAGLDRLGLQCPFYLMMSGGGLTTLEQAVKFPIRLVESGPAGGAIFAATLAGQRKLDKVLAFDMGGTTAKICLLDDGQPQRNRHFEIARVYRDMKGSGLPVRIPVIEMVEIGAGGGSIARIDSLQRITVGPDSAGSQPGPVAYGLGGQQPTVTDANLVLGKLDPQQFAGGKILLDQAAAERALQQTIGAPLQLHEHWPAVGVVEIVEENMANAARVHTIERGKEAAEYTMIAFGGGAPLHAARLAQKLGIEQIIIPPGAGVGSAIGFLHAPVSYQLVRSFRTVLDNMASTDLKTANDLLSSMAAATKAVIQSEYNHDTISLEKKVELRYRGQGHELSVALPNSILDLAGLAAVRERFESLYQRIYGLTMPDLAIEAISWSVTASYPTQPPPPLPPDPNQTGDLATKRTQSLYDPNVQTMLQAAWYWRPELKPGDRITGPALVAEDETTTVIPAGCNAWVDTGYALVLQWPTDELT